MQEYESFIQELDCELEYVEALVNRCRWGGDFEGYKRTLQELKQMKEDMNRGFCRINEQQSCERSESTMGNIADYLQPTEEEYEDSYAHFHNIDKLQDLEQENVTLKQEIEYLKKQLYVMSLKNCPVERSAILNSTLEFFKEVYNGN